MRPMSGLSLTLRFNVQTYTIQCCVRCEDGENGVLPGADSTWKIPLLEPPLLTYFAKGSVAVGSNDMNTEIQEERSRRKIPEE